MECLVNKIKTGLINNDLYTFNAFNVKVLDGQTDDELLFRFKSVGGNTTIIVTDGQVRKANGEISSSLTFGNNEVFDGWFNNGNCFATVTDRFVDYIQCGKKVLIDINTLFGCNSIKKIDCKYQAVGDLSNIETCTLIETLWFNECSNITGNIKSIGKLPNISALNIRDCKNIKGTIEDFVLEQRKIGRTTYTNIDVFCFPLSSKGGNITFNGVLVNSAAVAGEFSWTENSITWRGNTIEA